MAGKIRILVVDDSRAITMFVSDALNSTLGPVDVVTASNGEEAYQVASCQPLDLIISDWNMPRMSGRDLLERVRGEARTKDLPFIMLTANSDQESVRTAVSLGVSGYLLKPFTPEVLLSRVTSLLSKRQPQQK